MKWELDRIATAVSGTPTGAAVVSSVSTDSRTAVAGSLFVALYGEHFDGHDYLVEAVDRGAAAVLVDQGRLPRGVDGVEVADTLVGLRSLAVLRRGELGARFVAITGSSGKTSTKDLILGALATRAFGSVRSFNNEVGVPLTVLGAPDDAPFVVVEVGSRRRGDIALLSPAIRPDVAVITNVGRAHLETFGDEAGVLAAKWELIESLGRDGMAVLPARDDRLVARRVGGMITFGAAPADVVLHGLRLDTAGRASFVLRYLGVDHHLLMRSAGRHQGINAAAALATAVALGADPVEAAAGIAAAEVSSCRMQVHSGDITIVNDAYNANPDSMASALETVAAMPGRHIAVLGKMLELGIDEARLHREVGALAASLGFSPVIVVGDDPGVAVGAGEVAVTALGIQDALALLDGKLGAGDVVLVKASRGVGLERMVGPLLGADE